ncbi:MFS transporter [Clostridium sardiniense]|uniref:MFS transporter n=1 Tax=Clostridium sardiniense TaxID=29369 RepID=UPI001957892D|nr:MFS transporter [Clostridium sardiniense]MBM7836498.1 MFS family permease [Clostridium sardiniense]
MKISKKNSPFTEFLSFDKPIINYIIMHWFGGIFLIYTVLLPIFMNKLGIDISNAGLIIGLSSLFDIIFTFILSKFIDKVSPNKGICIDWITESIPPIIYGLSSTTFGFLLGTISSSITNILNPVYKIYESKIFPQENMQKIYTYHLVTPELFTILLYPLIGYLLTYKFPSILTFRIIFICCGIGFLFVTIFAHKNLKKINPSTIKTSSMKFKIPKELFTGTLASILININFSLLSTSFTIYYMLSVLKFSIFEIMIIEVIYSIASLATGFYTKNLTSKFKNEKIVQFGLIFFLAFSFLLTFGKSYMVIIIAYILKSIGNTIWFPSHYSILMKYIPSEISGKFFTKLSSLTKLLNIIVPIIAGFLAQLFGFFVPFGISIILLIILYFIYRSLLHSISNK